MVAELRCTLCPNLNSCMPKQIITQSRCAKGGKPCSATAWILLLGNTCQLGRGGRNNRDTFELQWNSFLLESFVAHHMILKWSAWGFSTAQHKLTWESSQSPCHLAPALQDLSWGLCGPPYRMWLLLLLLLELPDGFLGLLQLSTGLLALLFDCGQLPFDQVVLLCLLSSSHLSLGT